MVEGGVRCEVTKSREFHASWRELPARERNTVTAALERLQERGVTLDYPQSSAVTTSRYGHMRELRIDTRGEAIRVFYAFDPRRRAVVLVGGRKRGQDRRFYRRHVRQADAIYDRYLRALNRERVAGRGRER